MRIPRDELTEWTAFWQLEPFGSMFEEYRAALVASVIAEVNRDRKKRGRPFGPSDFMAEWDKPEKPAASAETMFEFVKALQAQMEVRAGKRSPGDLAAGTAPILYDSRGNPIER